MRNILLIEVAAATIDPGASAWPRRSKRIQLRIVCLGVQPAYGEDRIRGATMMSAVVSARTAGHASTPTLANP